MSDDKFAIRDIIDIEFKRVQIQHHPNFAEWYKNLSSHTQEVVNRILVDDVTPDLILFAQDAPDDEWNEYQFLRFISGGNPSEEARTFLTRYSLGEVFDSVEETGCVD